MKHICVTLFFEYFFLRQSFARPQFKSYIWCIGTIKRYTANLDIWPALSPHISNDFDYFIMRQNKFVHTNNARDRKKDIITLIIKRSPKWLTLWTLYSLRTLYLFQLEILKVIHIYIRVSYMDKLERCNLIPRRNHWKINDFWPHELFLNRILIFVSCICWIYSCELKA